jgi:hypothetical protein
MGFVVRNGSAISRCLSSALYGAVGIAAVVPTAGGFFGSASGVAKAVAVSRSGGPWGSLSPGCSQPSGFVAAVAAVQDRSIVGSGTYTVSVPRPLAGTDELAPSRGTQVEVVRCLPPGRLVQIATGRIEQADDTFYTAAVFVPHALASQGLEVPQRTLVTHRNLYWQPMRGDLVRVLDPSVIHSKKAWPELEFDLAEIFTTSPGDDGELLSLSSVGRKKLIEAFEALEQHRGRFLIESEQSGAGGADPAEWTAVRGGVVAQLLSRVFEMDPSRFVVRGLGGHVASEEMVPVRFFGGQVSQGRIVIRILPGE